MGSPSLLIELTNVPTILVVLSVVREKRHLLSPFMCAVPNIPKDEEERVEQGRETNT